MHYGVIMSKFNPHDYTEDDCVRIMQQCPRWDRCSVPSCPLDLKQSLRVVLPGDETCTMAKTSRYRIGKNTPLPRKGLTKLEWAAKQRWESKSETQRQQELSRLKKQLKHPRMKRGGGIMVFRGEDKREIS